MSTTLVACGGAPAPATPDMTSSSEPAPVGGSADSAPNAADSAAAAPGGVPVAKGKGVPEEKMRAAKSFEEPFPKIDATTAELGEPVAKGKAARREWLFNTRPLGKTYSCDTVDLIRSPSGAVVVDDSVLTSDTCKAVRATSEQVKELLAALSGDADLTGEVDDFKGKTFDEASALFDKKLGKANETGEPDFAAWSYVDDNQECRLVMVTSHLGSGAGQALWGLPCK